ncbi:hypothetical protein CPB84DRAFT_1828334 [Gymnopilus junonius]|uniref:Uncharacterized protein n=1 Tax=Gymnopilus junonius TaxID=109634 RepID=A0A9P5TH29_GYMJU|nr:hypothetical protein CPB84DRAFT_1828334 [Gymnopilus junonius]
MEKTEQCIRRPTLTRRKGIRYCFIHFEKPIFHHVHLATIKLDSKISDQHHVNSALSEMLLWGLYTVVYVVTLYIYLQKKASQNRVVVGVISLSYILYVVQLVIHWNTTQDSIVNGSETRETLFIAMTFGPGWNLFVNDICTFLMAALADGLLIWRCFYVWDRSIRAILLPSFLLFCEIVVDLSTIIFQSVVHLDASLDQGYTINKLLGASSFINLGATLSATLLISYRIYAVSKEDLQKSSRKLFQQVLEILVQSATAYVIVTLGYSISVVISYTPSNAAYVFAAQTYTYHFFIFIAGVAPAIMVAKAAVLDDTDRDISAVSHISGIRFHVWSTNPNATPSKWESADVDHGAKESLQDSEQSTTDLKSRENCAMQILQSTNRESRACTTRVRRELRSRAASKHIHRQTRSGIPKLGNAKAPGTGEQTSNIAGVTGNHRPAREIRT